MKLPKNTYLGKKQTNGIMVGGNPMYQETAQIYVVCHANKDGCHDSIALLANIVSGKSRNQILDAIPTEKAKQVFMDAGWVFKPKLNLCPSCASKKEIEQRLLPCNHKECIHPHEMEQGNCQSGKCPFNITTIRPEDEKYIGS